MDLQVAGYSMPTIAAHGAEALLVMIRESDGFRNLAPVLPPASGWSPGRSRRDRRRREEGGYAWPNVLGRLDGHLRFIVQGPAGGGQRTSVLAYQRVLGS